MAQDYREQGYQERFDYADPPPERGAYQNGQRQDTRRGGQQMVPQGQQAPAQRQQQTGMTKEAWEGAIRSGLTQELAAHAKALPEGFKQERFILNAVTVISDHATDFRNIAPESIILCLAKGAYLGLDFLNGECYAIPYSGVANFQTDYKGEIKLAKKYSRNPIVDIYAKNVRRGDFFEEVIENGRQSVNFKPQPFSDEEIIGSFAVVLYKDGSMIYDTMTKAEIEATRQNFSKAKNSAAWQKTPGEMYKKTVIRRLLKLVDLEFDSREQIQAFQEGSDMEFEPQRSGRSSTALLNDGVADIFGTGTVTE